MDVRDLSGPDPVDPQEALALDAALTAAHRGVAICDLGVPSWAVCKLCDRPVSGQAARSRCCAAPTRLQGWALPAVARA